MGKTGASLVFGAITRGRGEKYYSISKRERKKERGGKNPVVERRILHNSFRIKRPTAFSEEQMRSQVLSTDWSIKGDIDEDYESFVSKILHCAKVITQV